MVKLSREFNSLLSDGRYLKMGFVSIQSGWNRSMHVHKHPSEKDECKNGSRVGGHLRDKWQLIWGAFISDLVDSTKKFANSLVASKGLMFLCHLHNTLKASQSFPGLNTYTCCSLWMIAVH